MHGREFRAGDQVLGLELVKQLGAGGYGEVWSARDAGGWLKAVKFIFGGVEDRRAERELKSLQRVRSARHPFILSIERIEEVDQQLVVVTELAEGTLGDVFRKYRDDGRSGVPRDELLRYLADAAEALDFMLESHQLQHLDVKPENLLLLGGRVKVADFGLVKRFGDTSVSMMGGLTPSYAAPEVFDDSPSTRSDQYSLAIVYQHMLTGKLPFVGKTAAQLAKQHTMSRPQLDGLSDSDQAAIAKALSKEPGRRFESCAAMVEALRVGMPLIGSASEGGAILPELALGLGDGRRPRSPAVVGDIAAPTIAASPFPGGESPAADPPGELLDSLPVPAGAARLRPTLYLGLGGSGGRVVQMLRRKLSDRYGAMTGVPAIQTLAIDADSAALARLGDDQERAALHPHDLLHAPLQPAEAYRKQSDQVLDWLSRRWLYNIPRSLNTEGMRPLGRLAFVKHAPALFARIRAALAQIIAPESLERTQQTTGLELDSENPRVVVAANIGGGLASGMCLDLLYVLKVLLAQSGRDVDEVYSFLLFGTDRGAAAHDLSVANGAAFLQELHHFDQEQQYPGDASCGIPSVRARPGDAANTYLCHLGDDLSPEAFDDALERTADYLYLDACTRGGRAFAAARRQTLQRAAGGSSLTLRTMGLRRLGASPLRAAEALADSCAASLLLSWTGESPADLPRSFRQAVADAQQLTDQALHLVPKDVEEFLQADCWSSAAFQSGARDAVSAVLDEPLADQAEQFAGELGPVDWSEAAAVAQASLAEMNRRLSPTSVSRGAAADTQADAISKALGRYARQWLHDAQRLLEERLWRILNAPGVRFAGAAAWRKLMDERLAQLGQGAQEELAASQAKVEAATEEARALAQKPKRLLKKYLRKSGPGTPAFVDHLHSFLLESFQVLVLRQRIAALAQLRTRLADLAEVLIEMRRDIRLLTQEVELGPEWEQLEQEQEISDLDEASRLEMFQHILAELPQLTMELDLRLDRGYFKRCGGFAKLMKMSFDDRAELPTVVRSAAKNLVYDRLVQTVVGNPFEAPPEEAPELEEQLRGVLAAARPRPAQWGGATRLFVFADADADAARIKTLMSETLGEPSATFCPTNGEYVVCYEGEGVWLADAAEGLLQGRYDLLEAAQRLHVRSDVHWTPLPLKSLAAV